MQTAYGRRVQRGHSPRTGGGSRSQESAERSRLLQLLVCVALFLVVFIGKGVFPSHLAQTGSQLLTVIRSNTDFRAALAGLGQALAEQDSVLGELGEFCVSVFGPAKADDGVETPVLPALSAGRETLTARADQNQLTARLLGLEELPEELQVSVPTPDVPEPEPKPEMEAEPEPEPAVQEEPEILEVGAVIRPVDTPKDLPKTYTMNYLSLGELETADPVEVGRITSGFGYRDHPVLKTYSPHGGVDIGANLGSSVTAFAAGRVEYIGQSDSFGLYLQIDHGNGVKTFYAHCSKLLVKKGQQVALGEPVALVGSTGNSTGPHLHFEIKCCGLRVNPVYYLDLAGAG